MGALTPGSIIKAINWSQPLFSSSATVATTFLTLGIRNDGTILYNGNSLISCKPLS